MDYRTVPSTFRDTRARTDHIPCFERLPQQYKNREKQTPNEPEQHIILRLPRSTTFVVAKKKLDGLVGGGSHSDSVLAA